MAKFVEIDKTFTFSKDKPKDFWELNPQLRIIEPFDELYPHSEKMWGIFFWTEPDNNYNKLYTLDKPKRLESIKKYIDPEFNPVELDKYILAYRKYCLSAESRELSEWISMAEMASNALRNLQTADVDDIRKAFIAMEKGLNVLEKMHDLQQKLDTFKNDFRVIGGRKETLSEQGLL